MTPWSCAGTIRIPGGVQAAAGTTGLRCGAVGRGSCASGEEGQMGRSAAPGGAEALALVEIGFKAQAVAFSLHPLT